jgi:hypothetical protein
MRVVHRVAAHGRQASVRVVARRLRSAILAALATAKAAATIASVSAARRQSREVAAKVTQVRQCSASTTVPPRR